MLLLIGTDHTHETSLWIINIFFSTAGEFEVYDNTLLNYETLPTNDLGYHFRTYVVGENWDYLEYFFDNQTTFFKNDILLAITVTDVPEPVTISNLNTGTSLSEDAVTSSTVYFVTYGDEDLNDNYTFSISDTVPAAAPFAIDMDGEYPGGGDSRPNDGRDVRCDGIKWYPKDWKKNEKRGQNDRNPIK